MTVMDVFAKPGRFFRGNLHTHSTLSDGLLAPEEVCRRYREAGYDFICLSDHCIGLFDYPIADTTPFRTNSFTTLIGAEMHSGAMANGELWHMLVVGLPRDFAAPEAPHFLPVEGMESAAALARRCREAGAFVAIAHPQWSGLTVEDALAIDAAHAVEIYNHGCAVDSDRGDGAAILDQLLSAGRRLTACATDDAHFAGPDHFGGWVMVKAESPEPDALLGALKRGDYYASQGPELFEIGFDGKRLRVAASTVERIVVVGAGTASAVQYRTDFARDSGGRIETEFAIPRLANSPWIRVAAIDAEGRRAWSNPIWRD